MIVEGLHIGDKNFDYLQVMKPVHEIKRTVTIELVKPEIWKVIESHTVKETIFDSYGKIDDVESKVESFYEKKGYKVCNLDPKEKLSKYPDIFESKILEISDDDQVPTGIPDLIIYKDGYYEFVEVKRPGGNFSKKQLSFILNPNINTRVCFIWADFETEFSHIFCKGCESEFDYFEEFKKHDCDFVCFDCKTVFDNVQRTGNHRCDKYRSINQ